MRSTPQGTFSNAWTSKKKQHERLSNIWRPQFVCFEFQQDICFLLYYISKSKEHVALSLKLYDIEAGYLFQVHEGDNKTYLTRACNAKHCGLWIAGEPFPHLLYFMSNVCKTLASCWPKGVNVKVCVTCEFDTNMYKKRKRMCCWIKKTWKEGPQILTHIEQRFNT